MHINIKESLYCHGYLVSNEHARIYLHTMHFMVPKPGYGSVPLKIRIGPVNSLPSCSWDNLAPEAIKRAFSSSTEQL
jgi:hypothetical protein